MSEYNTHEKDQYYMELALAMADYAASIGEVPVGAVIVDQDGELISQAYNRTITDNDPSAHAEIVALRAAGQKKANYRLNDLCLYVTLEPCIMCLGAIFHARIARLVYAAADPKTGACGGFANVAAMPGFNHHTQIQGGVLARQSANLLKEFFKKRR